MIDISIIVPGIRNEAWQRTYNSLKESVGNKSFEVIFCGPYAMPGDLYLDNVKYIRELGSPARALQIASLFVEGKYLTWMPDDCIARQNAIQTTTDILNERNNEKDIVCMRYVEDFTKPGQEQHFHERYWMAWYHEALRLPGISQNWAIPLISFLRTSYFRYLGGLDCRFEQANMNVIDMGFRAQMDGASIIIPPFFAMDAFWEPRDATHPLVAADIENDKPLFNSIYSAPGQREIQIPYDNWKESPKIWKRRI